MQLIQINHSNYFQIMILFQKLFQIYVRNEIDYMFLDDLLKATEKKVQACAHDALLWLKR